MTDVVEKLNEDDIYRWSYRNPGDDRAWGRYHCCSRIAIVYRGILRDTYWQIGKSFSEGRSFGPEDLHKIELTRITNLADLEKVPEYQADYYDDSDIVNLNHANSPKGNFYLRKGAVRSQAKMLEVARYNLERSLSAERMAADRVKDLRDIISRLEAGEMDIHIPSSPR